MTKKTDLEVGNYFYNKRHAEGTLHEQKSYQWLWELLFVLYQIAFFFLAMAFAFSVTSN